MTDQEKIDFTLQFFANALRKKAQELSAHTKGTNKSVQPGLLSSIQTEGKYDIQWIFLLHFQGAAPLHEIIRDDLVLAALVVRKLELAAARLESKIGSVVDISDLQKLQDESLR